MMNSSVALTVLLERLIVAVGEALIAALEAMEKAKKYLSSYDGSRNCSALG
jgi:hypothetical protein